MGRATDHPCLLSWLHWSPEATTGLYSGDCSVRSVWEVQGFSVTYSVSVTQTPAVTSGDWRCSEESA